MSDDFYGLRTRAVENEHLRVEFLAEAGPRLVRLFRRGSSENWLAEVPQKKVSTPYGDYFFRGGHRLWCAPERMPETYLPDHAGLTVEELPDGIRLCQPVEPWTGMRKSITIRLDPCRAALALTHRIENTAAAPVELAPWAITMLKLGGAAILPQPMGAVDAPGFLPNRHLVLWAYTRIDDPRLELSDAFIRVHARAELPACKIGYLNRAGWIAYGRDGVWFVKRFAPQTDQPHVDFNCNVEVYCNDEFIELETLAPLVRLEPGQSVTHDETWELHGGVELESLLREWMQ
jgi:hypothetical protein